LDFSPTEHFFSFSLSGEKKNEDCPASKEKGFKSFNLADWYKCDSDVIGALQQGWMRKNSNGKEQCEKFEWQESH